MSEKKGPGGTFGEDINTKIIQAHNLLRKGDWFPSCFLVNVGESEKNPSYLIVCVERFHPNKFVYKVFNSLGGFVDFIVCVNPMQVGKLEPLITPVQGNGNAQRILREGPNRGG